MAADRPADRGRRDRRSDRAQRALEALAGKGYNFDPGTNYRICNRMNDKCLGIQSLSTADRAQVGIGGHRLQETTGCKRVVAGLATHLDADAVGFEFLVARELGEPQLAAVGVGRELRCTMHQRMIREESTPRRQRSARDER